jgi:hypothetical protein
LAAVLVGVSEGTVVGVGELVGMGELVAVPVGALAGPADGVGVTVFITGWALVGVAAGRSVGVALAAAALAGPVVAGVSGVCATSVGPIETQPAIMTAVTRIKAISLGDLSFLWSAGYSGIIILAYLLNLTQTSIRICLSLAISVDDTSTSPPRAN